MKRFSLFLMFLSVAVLAAQFTMAQEKDDKKEKDEIHVIVKVVEDGTEKMIDTILHEFKDHGEIIEQMGLKGMADSLMKEHMVLFSDDKESGKHKKRMKAFCFSSDSLHPDSDHVVKTVKKIKSSDCDGYFFKHSGDGGEKEIKVEVIHAGDHKVHVHPSCCKKKKKIIIANASEDVEITEEDGYKIIKIKTSGDDNVWIEKDIDVETEIEVEINEPDKKKKTKKSKRKK